jgi:hypothetical protein
MTKTTTLLLKVRIQTGSDDTTATETDLDAALLLARERVSAAGFLVVEANRTKTITAP